MEPPKIVLVLIEASIFAILGVSWPALLTFLGFGASGFVVPSVVWAPLFKGSRGESKLASVALCYGSY